MVEIICDWPDADPALSCCWPISSETDCSCPDEAEANPELFIAMAEVASTMLTRLSGYTIGQCEAILRPLDICPKCRSWCCGGADGIRLTGPNQRPVSQVIAVHIGETTLLPEEYHYDPEYSTLWRVPPGTWPTKDNRWAECGEPGAFCVDAVVGAAPDAWALQVATTLTCELMQSCLGGKCRLPRNATQVTGQGITIQLRADDINMMLPEVSAWVAAVNPYGARLPAAIFSPELEQPASRGSGSWSTMSLPGSYGGYGLYSMGGCCG